MFTDVLHFFWTYNVFTQKQYVLDGWYAKESTCWVFSGQLLPSWSSTLTGHIFLKDVESLSKVFWTMTKLLHKVDQSLTFGIHLTSCHRIFSHEQHSHTITASTNGSKMERKVVMPLVTLMGFRSAYGYSSNSTLITFSSRQCQQALWRG